MVGQHQADVDHRLRGRILRPVRSARCGHLLVLRWQSADPPRTAGGKTVLERTTEAAAVSALRLRRLPATRLSTAARLPAARLPAARLPAARFSTTEPPAVRPANALALISGGRRHSPCGWPHRDGDEAQPNQGAGCGCRRGEESVEAVGNHRCPRRVGDGDPSAGAGAVSSARRDERTSRLPHR